MKRFESRYAWIAAFFVIFVGANGLYAVEATRAPLLSQTMTDRQTFMAAHAHLGRAEARARGYWARYPDVARDTFFGEDGGQGVFGPFVHFERHGRSEGRLWGP